MNKLDVWLMNLPFRKRMIDKVTSRYYHEFFKELADKNILEIGCGHGFGAKAISKNFSPKKIVATDLDPRMISSAKKNVDDPVIVFEEADAARLPYKNNNFDAVFDYGTIHHIPGPQWKNCLEELYRVLSPGGKVFIYDISIDSFNTLFGRLYKIFNTHPYSSMYKKSEFLDYLKFVGFKILKEVDLGRYFIVIAEKPK